MADKVITDPVVIEQIRNAMPVANSSRNGLLSAVGSYKLVQNFKIGSRKNAVSIGNIRSWERVTFLFFGIHVRTRYCALVSVYNTDNNENTAPYIFVDKILNDFPFKVYYKKVTGSSLDLVIKQTVDSSGDSEDVNILGDNLAAAILLKDTSGYTEVSI